MFLRKDWTAQLCLDPELYLPATTRVPRQAIARNPRGAADRALRVLRQLNDRQVQNAQRWAKGACQPVLPRISGLRHDEPVPEMEAT